MAIATRHGHVARAIEFFKRNDKYFAVGRTTPWDDETQPPAPSTTAYDIEELVGLKKVDNCYLVVPDNVNGTIEYRGSKWRIVTESLETTVAGIDPIPEGTLTIPVTSLLGMAVGQRLRVAKLYEGTITAIDPANNKVTLDTATPAMIEPGSPVEGGALVEGARWVYMDAYLRYDQFPLVTYRQIGIYSSVEPSNVDTMRSKAYSDTGENEYIRAGILEVLDNRKPTPREIDQKEMLSLIIEF